MPVWKDKKWEVIMHDQNNWNLGAINWNSPVWSNWLWGSLGFFSPPSDVPPESEYTKRGNPPMCMSNIQKQCMCGGGGGLALPCAGRDPCLQGGWESTLNTPPCSCSWHVSKDALMIALMHELCYCYRLLLPNTAATNFLDSCQDLCWKNGTMQPVCSHNTLQAKYGLFVCLISRPMV